MNTPFYKQVRQLKVGGTLADPTLPGLRYRARKTGTYAEYRYKDRKGDWKASPLGRVALADVYYEDQGKMRLGAKPGEKTLEALHNEALALADKIAKGVDIETEADWKSFTLAQAIDLHLSGKDRSELTVQDYRLAVDRHMKDWRTQPLASLSRAEVRKRHQEISKTHGSYAANKTMRVLRALWNRARRQYPELPESPTANVDWNEEVRRDAAIPLASLPQWYKEVMALRNPIRRDFYRLTVLTGLRRRTVDRIRLGDIDLDAKTLHIPKPKGGEKRQFDIPLSDFAVEIIKARLADNKRWWEDVNKWRERKGKEPQEPNDYLFPAHGKAGHLTEPKPSGGDAFSVEFTIHGLRNTYLSAAAAAGVSPYHAKLLANHALPKADVTAGYIGKDVDALRPSQQAITDYLKAAMKVDQGQEGASAKVVALHAS